MQGRARHPPLAPLSPRPLQCLHCCYSFVHRSISCRHGAFPKALNPQLHWELQSLPILQPSRKCAPPRCPRGPARRDCCLLSTFPPPPLHQRDLPFQTLMLPQLPRLPFLLALTLPLLLLALLSRLLLVRKWLVYSLGASLLFPLSSIASLTHLFLLPQSPLHERAFHLPVLLLVPVLTPILTLIPTLVLNLMFALTPTSTSGSRQVKAQLQEQGTALILFPGRMNPLPVGVEMGEGAGCTEGRERVGGVGNG